MQQSAASVTAWSPPPGSQNLSLFDVLAWPQAASVGTAASSTASRHTDALDYSTDLPDRPGQFEVGDWLLSRCAADVDDKVRTKWVTDALCRPEGTDEVKKALRVQNAKILKWVLRGCHNEAEHVWRISTLQFCCLIVQKALEVADRTLGNFQPLRDVAGYEEDRDPKDPNREPRDAKVLIVSVFHNRVKEACEHKWAHFVVEQCIKFMPREKTWFILQYMAEQTFAVAAAANMCAYNVLMRLIEHHGEGADVGGHLNTIVEQLIARDVATQRPQNHDPHQRFVNNPWANFVFKNLLEYGVQWQTRVVDEVLLVDTSDLAQLRCASMTLTSALALDQNFPSGRANVEKIIDKLCGREDCSEHARSHAATWLASIKNSKYGSFIYKQLKKACEDSSRVFPTLPTESQSKDTRQSHKNQKIAKPQPKLQPKAKPKAKPKVKAKGSEGRAGGGEKGRGKSESKIELASSAASSMVEASLRRTTSAMSS